MGKIAEAGSDIVTAGSAISGLLLVYIGALSTAFAGFEPQERRSVAGSYQRRAWFGFVGLVLFLVSVVLALIGKWRDFPCATLGALMLLFVGLVWVVITAALSAMEIK